MTKVLLAAMAAALVAPYVASAEDSPDGWWLDGNTLYSHLQQPDSSYWHSFAVGYVVGAFDALQDLASVQQVRRACFPEQVKVPQLADVVKKYLADNPSKRHFSASSTAMIALVEAFPCDAGTEGQ